MSMRLQGVIVRSTQRSGIGKAVNVSRDLTRASLQQLQTRSTLHPLHNSLAEPFWSQVAEMFVSLFQWLAVFTIMFGGVIPYIPQYLEIRRTRDSEGFSLYVCLTLLIANILRIFFWFGHPFELPLLIQSFVMIACMMFMVHICVTVRYRSDIVIGRQKTFTDFTWEDIWRWTDFVSYIQFLCTFALVVGSVTIFFINQPIFVELLGLSAVLFEALLGVPQFWRNMLHKSTAGMSISMVLLWTAGDVLKTVYFVVRNAPAQFWICGTLQVCIDIAILFQVFVYSNVSTNIR